MNTYNNVPVVITENGISDNNGTLHDQHRIDYIQSYTNEILKGRIVYSFYIVIPLLYKATII